MANQTEQKGRITHRYPMATRLIAVTLAIALILSLIVFQPSWLFGADRAEAAGPETEQGGEGAEEGELTPFLQALRIANNQYLAGEYELALEQLALCRSYVEEEEDTALCFALEGNIFYGQEHYDKALESYRQVIGLEQEQFGASELYFLTARCLLLMEDYAGCLEEVQIGLGFCTQGDEYTPLLYLVEGTAHFYGVAYEAAIVSFQQAIANGYTEPEALEGIHTSRERHLYLSTFICIFKGIGQDIH